MAVFSPGTPTIFKFSPYVFIISILLLLKVSGTVSPLRSPLFAVGNDSANDISKPPPYYIEKREEKK